MNCIFCMIRDGKAPVYKIYEDEHTLAFLDKNPVVDGHTLLITKTHKQYVEELSEKTAMHLMRTLIKITPCIQRAMNTTDSNIAINNGPKSGQLVPHIHVHILPRSKPGVSLFSEVSSFKPRKQKYFQNIADKIRREIECTR